MDQSVGRAPNLLFPRNKALDFCLGSCIMDFVELIKKEKIVEFT
jgi:hypothetical protein